MPSPVNGHLMHIVQEGLAIARLGRPTGREEVSHALTVRSLLERAQTSFRIHIAALPPADALTPQGRQLYARLGQVALAATKLEKALSGLILPPPLTPLEDAQALTARWKQTGIIPVAQLSRAREVRDVLEGEQRELLAQTQFLDSMALPPDERASSTLLLEARRELGQNLVLLMRLRQMIQAAEQEGDAAVAALLREVLSAAGRRGLPLADPQPAGRFYQFRGPGNVPVSRTSEDWTIYVRPRPEEFLNAWKVVVKLLTSTGMNEPWFGDMQIHVRPHMSPLETDKYLSIEIDVNRHLLRPLAEYLANDFWKAGIKGQNDPPPFAAPIVQQRGIFYKQKTAEEDSLQDRRAEIVRDIRRDVRAEPGGDLLDQAVYEAQVRERVERAMEVIGFAGPHFHRRSETPDPFDDVVLNEEGQKNDLVVTGLNGQLAAVSHVGGRKNQEDALVTFYNPKTGELTLIAADGMGGYEGGEIASRHFTVAVREKLEENKPLDEVIAAGEESVRLEAGEHLARANALVAGGASPDDIKREKNLAAMGLTYVAAQIRFGQLAKIMWKGDPRLYLIRPRTQEIIQVTEDHNLACHNYCEEKRAAGAGGSFPLRNEAEAEYYDAFQNSEPKVRSTVTRAVMLPPAGRDPPPPGEISLPTTLPDGSALVPEQGDLYLLCSDGLHDFLPRMIRDRILFSKSLSVEQKSHALRDASILGMSQRGKEVLMGIHSEATADQQFLHEIHLAAAAGIGKGGDNVTAVLFKV